VHSVIGRILALEIEGIAMPATTTTRNNDTVTREGYCIVGCGFEDLDHGPYCERQVGNKANAVTEPGWQQVQFWCSVIQPYIHGTVSKGHARDCDRYRDGVQLTATIRDDSSSDAYKWRDVHYNLTPGEARQLAAQLVAAADSHDLIDRSHLLAAELDRLVAR
jgi:hypothetical protein